MEPTEAGRDFNFLTVMKTAFPLTAAVTADSIVPQVTWGPRMLPGRLVAEAPLMVAFHAVLGRLRMSKGSSAFVCEKRPSTSYHGDLKNVSFPCPASVTFPSLI